MSVEKLGEVGMSGWNAFGRRGGSAGMRDEKGGSDGWEMAAGKPAKGVAGLWMFDVVMGLEAGDPVGEEGGVAAEEDYGGGD